MSQAAPAVGDSASETSGGESVRTAKPGEGHRTHACRYRVPDKPAFNRHDVTVSVMVGGPHQEVR